MVDDNTGLVEMGGSIVAVNDDGFEVNDPINGWSEGDQISVGQIDRIETYYGNTADTDIQIWVSDETYDVISDLLVDLQESGFKITKVEFEKGYITAEK